jgi:membrane protease YdiL (CAAX protease family)
MSLFRRLLASNLGQLVIEIVVIAVPVLLLVVLVNLFPATFLQNTAGDALFNIAEALIIAVVFLWALRRIEHSSRAEAGLSGQQWLRQLLLSFICGGALMTVVILALALTGSYRITGINALAAVQFAFLIVALGLFALLFTRSKKVGFFHYVSGVFLIFGLFPTTVSLLILIAGAIQEELIFRGLLFRKLERSFGSWIALVVSAILFGIIHLASPNATLVSALAIMVTSGVLIAATYILTRSLWWAMGIHLGWNFFEGPVFGTQLSGHDLPGFFSSVTTGPIAWAGGSFGPEAGLASILIVGAVGVFLCFRAARQQRMLPRPQRQEVPSAAQAESTEVPASL